MRTRLHRLLDRRRRTGAQHLKDHARRRGADVRNFLEGAVRVEQRIDRQVERHHRRSRALVAPSALLRLLHERQVAKPAGDIAIDVDHESAASRFVSPSPATRAPATSRTRITRAARPSAGSLCRKTTAGRSRERILEGLVNPIGSGWFNHCGGGCARRQDHGGDASAHGHSQKCPQRSCDLHGLTPKSEAAHRPMRDAAPHHAVLPAGVSSSLCLHVLCPSGSYANPAVACGQVPLKVGRQTAHEILCAVSPDAALRDRG